MTVSLPLATLAPLACTLDLQTHHTQPTGHEARHTREARLATFGRLDASWRKWKKLTFPLLGFTPLLPQLTECLAQSTLPPHLLLMRRYSLAFATPSPPSEFFLFFLQVLKQPRGPPPSYDATVKAIEQKLPYCLTFQTIKFCTLFSVQWTENTCWI